MSNPFEFDPKPINMDIFKGRIAAGAWEVVERVGDDVGFVIFTGKDADIRARLYARGAVAGVAKPVEDDEDIGDLF